MRQCRLCGRESVFSRSGGFGCVLKLLRLKWSFCTRTRVLKGRNQCDPWIGGGDKQPNQRSGTNQLHRSCLLWLSRFFGARILIYDDFFRSYCTPHFLKHIHYREHILWRYKLVAAHQCIKVNHFCHTVKLVGSRISMDMIAYKRGLFCVMHFLL